MQEIIDVFGRRDVKETISFIKILQERTELSFGFVEIYSYSCFISYTGHQLKGSKRTMETKFMKEHAM